MRFVVEDKGRRSAGGRPSGLNNGLLDLLSGTCSSVLFFRLEEELLSDFEDVFLLFFPDEGLEPETFSERYCLAESETILESEEPVFGRYGLLGKHRV